MLFDTTTESCVEYKDSLILLNRMLISSVIWAFVADFVLLHSLIISFSDELWQRTDCLTVCWMRSHSIAIQLCVRQYQQ